MKGSIVSILAVSVGTGVLTLPRAVSNSGLIFGILLIILSGMITYYFEVLLTNASFKYK